jgi:UDP-2,3-diacylglucosamine pyrophosphatase LpxH
MKLHYRTVWISDAHLGTRGCRAQDLARFLKRIRCEHLYLVGDILDLSQLKHRWYWPKEQNDVVRRILKMAKRGTNVVYIPGNHDEAAREYIGMEFGGVRVERDAFHRTAAGAGLYITHGDQFDLIVSEAPWLSWLGGTTYNWLVLLNHFYNKFRRLCGRPYWSLARAVKLKVKGACTYFSRYEQALLKETRRRGAQGVVCGHIHKAEARREGDVFYYNCGDWIESCTALVEHDDGTVELIDGLAVVAPPAAATVAHPALAEPFLVDDDGDERVEAA